MNRLLPLLILTFSGFAVWASLELVIAADDPLAQKKEETPLQYFMRAKLKASDQVLEGLVTERFDLIVAFAVVRRTVCGNH